MLASSVRALDDAVQAAEDLLRDGRHREAMQAYLRLLDRRLTEWLEAGAQAKVTDLVVIERTAELASLFALVGAADDLLNAMAQLCRDAGNDMAADYAQLKRAEMLLGHDRVRAAFDVLCTLAPRIGNIEEISIDHAGLSDWERGTAWRLLAPEDRSVLLTRSYALMGHLLLALGRYNDALQMIARGLVHAEAEAAPDLSRRARPVLRFLQARGLMERGDFEASLAALPDFTIDATSALGVANHVQRLGLAGKVALIRGQFGEAARRLREQVDACEKAGLPHARAVAGLNLAHALVLLNRVGEALAHVDQARDIARSLDDRVLEQRCGLVADVAVARRSSGQEAMTVALSVREMIAGRAPLRLDGDLQRPQSLATSAESAGFLARFEERALAFQWRLNAEPAQAEREYADLQNVYAGTDSRLIQARVLALGGLFEAVRGRHAAAAAQHEAAAHAHEALGSLPEAWQSLQLRARSLMLLGRRGEAARCTERAGALLDALAGSLEGGERAIYLLNKATAEEAVIEARVDRLVGHAATARDGSPLRRLTARVAMLGELRKLVRHLDRHRAALADRQVHDGASGDTRQSRLPKAAWRWPSRDRATLVFVVMADRVLVAWSTLLGRGFAISPVTRVELREQVRRWHEHTQETLAQICAGRATPEILAAREARDAAMLERLGQMILLERVLGQLPERVSRLSIVADDVLHGLPFAALRHDGGYLVERFAITMSFESRPAPPAERRVGHGLVIGVGQNEGHAVLEAVGQECESVRAWLQQRGVAAEILREKEASLENVARYWCDASLIHAACHGTFKPDRPDQSGILLAGPDGKRQCLTIRDLAALRMKHCRHITLSACSSADNFILPGRWVISLPEVLWRSGAQSVLGAIWPVADEVTRLFMQRFYEALDGLPRDKALREAQLSLLRHTGLKHHLADTPLHAPRFWAGYVLHGESGPLQWARRGR
jgi:CHAT domain-containing protein